VPKPVAVKIPVAVGWFAVVVGWTGVDLTPPAETDVAGAGARPIETVEPATGEAVVNCT
jgi:hypothetical protein